MSCGSGTLLGVSQWESEKEGRSFGGARRMNAATQTAGQFRKSANRTAIGNPSSVHSIHVAISLPLLPL
jgi:hypothetical protein